MSLKGSTVAYGKTILLGEHAAVRGHRSLVLPLKSRALHLAWERTEGEGIEVVAGDFAPAFTAALHEALRLRQAVLPAGHWRFTLDSTIPPRAGLGSSAALSVALARFLAAVGFAAGPLFPLALALENLFHGTSSGMDVAAVLEGEPILFRRGEPWTRLRPAWRPALYLSDTGLRSGTKECVAKVAALKRNDLDERMAAAVARAETALTRADGLEELRASLDEGLAIFRAWGLVPPVVEEEITSLRAAGALAVKPTGSGDGGYLMSLWPAPAANGLIPVWADS